MASERTILIVDDDHHIRHVLAYKLGQQGLTVMSAGNGHEALEMARRNPPAVVITDLQMPVMGGLDLAVALRLKKTSTT